MTYQSVNPHNGAILTTFEEFTDTQPTRRTMTPDLSGNNLVLGIVIAVVVLVVLDLIVAGGGMMTGMTHVMCTPWGGLLTVVLVIAVLLAVLL